MPKVYRSEHGREAVHLLYDQQLKSLGIAYKDLFVKTDFGKSHLLKTGNPKGKPLLVFHGGNITTAYNLYRFQFLLKTFCIYALDTIGQPGKSAETVLSPNSLDYGSWARQVIEQLGYAKMLVIGESYGAGIITKLMAIAPEMIEKGVLLVPSGISNNLSLSVFPLAVSMLHYRLTKKNDYLIKTALALASSQDETDLDSLILPTLKSSFDHVRVRSGLPSNISKEAARKVKAPLLIMAAEKDCLFPAKKVLPRAQTIFNNCQIHELKNRGHLCHLTKQEKDHIVAFLEMEENL